MDLTTSIAERFNGPPSSANGGYTCGITAAALAGPAEVSLRLPPPIGRPLRVVTEGEESTLLDGDAVVAVARPTRMQAESPEPVGFGEARAASARFDIAAYHAAHWFPTCFTCGPGRDAGDGLRLFPGEVDRPGSVIAWPWVPDPSLPTASGALDPAIVWAALDCPSGWAWFHQRDRELRPHVLGRLAVDINRCPRPGENAVAAGWPVDVDGRKARSGSAIWSAEGELLAIGQATWIELTQEQFTEFRVATS